MFNNINDQKGLQVIFFDFKPRTCNGFEVNILTSGCYIIEGSGSFYSSPTTRNLLILI